MERKKLVRQEIWEAITKKYPSLKVFSLYCQGCYQSRKALFKIMIEMDIHKSRHLNRTQKEKIKYEINLKMIKKL